MKRKSKEEEKIDIQNEMSQAVSGEEAGDEQSRDKAEDISLAAKLEEKTKEAEDNYNKFLRMQADFDNFRKRVAREREEIYSTCLEGIVKELLPVVDNMERAVSAFRGDGLDSKYVDGIDMVNKQLLGVLDKSGVKEIESAGKEFDPNVHHAVMQVDAEDEQENTVIEVFQKGYTLGSKVVRPSLVKVAVKNN